MWRIGLGFGLAFNWCSGSIAWHTRDCLRPVLPFLELAIQGWPTGLSITINKEEVSPARRGLEWSLGPLGSSVPRWKAIRPALEANHAFLPSWANESPRTGGRGSGQHRSVGREQCLLLQKCAAMAAAAAAPMFLASSYLAPPQAPGGAAARRERPLLPIQWPASDARLPAWGCHVGGPAACV